MRSALCPPRLRSSDRPTRSAALCIGLLLLNNQVLIIASFSSAFTLQKLHLFFFHPRASNFSVLTMPSISAIPSFYRIWFTTIDPLFSLLGVTTNLFSPASVLTSYSIRPASPPATETMFLLDTVAGMLGGLMVFQVYLMRAKPTDLVVWRAVQAATVLVDIGMLGGFLRAMGREGRMGIGRWRGEEWINLGFLVTVLGIRGAFLGGLGIGTKSKSG